VRVRIASLVPSATETLYELGLGDSVVAVTHECDWPPGATELPRLTRSVVPDGLGPAEVDAAVRELTARGEAIYALDEDLLRRAQPDLIVTQAVCAVCAVSYDDVRAVAARLPGSPGVISMDPATLDDVVGDLPRLAARCGVEGAGKDLAARLQGRLRRTAELVAGAPRPRVLALEWLDPPYVGGHWVPEMIAVAGGDDVLASPGERSVTARWSELASVRPEVVVVMPCGLYAEAAAAECRRYASELAGLGAERLYAVDAASSFSRPGPRLVDGVELLAHLLHPRLVPEPEGIAWRALAA
jgi:iron complex transport system substrate-binding protein